MMEGAVAVLGVRKAVLRIAAAIVIRQRLVRRRYRGTRSKPRTVAPPIRVRGTAIYAKALLLLWTFTDTLFLNS
jgi:hypothetical protein